MNFLPMTMEELEATGVTQPDFICVTGDAYVDHPSFGIAIISRYLESMGFSVAMLSQPSMRHNKDFTRYGAPKYGFFVTGGNIDTMVNNYSVAKRKREEDVYSPGGQTGLRPDRATIAYTKKLKNLYPDSPVIIGGVEASLRRFAHYDYWADTVMESILTDSGADLLIYGMGEHQTHDIATAFKEGKTVEEMRDIKGICYVCKQFELPSDHVTCGSFTKVSEDMVAYAKATKTQIVEHDHIYGKAIVQKQSDDSFLVQTPPSPPLDTEELDKVFALPFMRAYHPSYQNSGGVKAIEEVEFSIMHNRGCFGTCNFCAITFHQGRAVTSRSHESVVAEAESFIGKKGFKGYIHDVGGPTANFRGAGCKKQLTKGFCKDKKCLGFNPCPSLKSDHSDYLDMLRKLRNIQGVKKVFVRSGIRYDYLLLDKDSSFMQELVEHHVSGQLKVAPEHCSNNVLKHMGKPPIGTYEKFSQMFYKTTKKLGKEQYLVPYLMSSHPGSTINDAIELSMFLKKNNMRPEQVQDFYPTPGTVSTCMFYTGLDPMTMEPVYVPKTSEEKRTQRAMLQYYKPENKRLIINSLIKCKKEYLIGTGKDCLVAPDAKYIQDGKMKKQKERQKQEHSRNKNSKPRRGAGRR